MNTKNITLTLTLALTSAVAFADDAQTGATVLVKADKDTVAVVNDSTQQVADTTACANDTIKQTVDTVAVATVKQDNAYAERLQRINYLRQVYDHAVYAQNISSRINLGLQGLGKDITLDGKLQMRRGQVIRLTIVPFGLMEVARLEFTPSYVLLIDRVHKEYVKASYSEVSFLKSEGLTFYTLQSLFWNELFQPGKAKLSDGDLASFSLNRKTNGMSEIGLGERRLQLCWTTDKKAYITNTDITYDKKTKNESSVNVAYSNFVTLGTKRFPAHERITFNTKAFSTGTMTLDINMGTISTDGGWEATTTVSDRYKKVTAEEFFARLSKL